MHTTDKAGDLAGGLLAAAENLSPTTRKKARRQRRRRRALFAVAAVAAVGAAAVVASRSHTSATAVSDELPTESRESGSYDGTSRPVVPPVVPAHAL